ncbi:MAG: CoA transferase, partial [Lutispora sp.]
REDLLKMDIFKTNPDRVANVEKLKEYMTEITMERTTAQWDEYFNKNGIPCSPINTIDKLFADPQVLARNMLVEVEQPGVGKIKIAGNPIKLSDMEEEIPTEPAPQIGEHNELILKKYLAFGYEQEDELEDEEAI